MLRRTRHRRGKDNRGLHCCAASKLPDCFSWQVLSRLWVSAGLVGRWDHGLLRLSGGRGALCRSHTGCYREGIELPSAAVAHWGSRGRTGRTQPGHFWQHSIISRTPLRPRRAGADPGFKCGGRTVHWQKPGFPLPRQSVVERIRARRSRACGRVVRRNPRDRSLP